MPETILHIDASARLADSVSRQLSSRIVERLGGDVIRRDLAQPLPQITQDWVTANFTPPEDRSTAQRDTLALSDRLVDELHAARTIVIGTPIYNFGVPAALKAWIDLVARAGLTFRYSDTGPVGLLTGKRAIIAIASGGTAVGSEIDFASGYLRHVLGFLGITEVEIIAADQIMINADQALAGAHERIDTLAA